MSMSQFVPVVSAAHGNKAQSPAYNLPTTTPATCTSKYWAAVVDVFFKYTLWALSSVKLEAENKVYWLVLVVFFLLNPSAVVKPVEVPAVEEVIE